MSAACPGCGCSGIVIMQVSQLIKDAALRLQNAGIPDSDLEAELLLRHILDIDRVQLFLHGGQVVANPNKLRFEECLQRRLNREPLAYIIGEREFWSLPFRVCPDVLIPRPETELLVEKAVAVLRRDFAGFPRKILDVGTGSGVIAIVLALEFPEATVWALDRSVAALKVAKGNALRHGVAERLNFLAADLLSGVRPDELFQMVVANPPYVHPDAIAELQPEVRDFEPHLALDGGPDGLEIIRILSRDLGRVLCPGGWVFMEIGADQGGAVVDIFQAVEIFEELQVIPDYAGLPRILQARKRVIV